MQASCPKKFLISVYAILQFFQAVSKAAKPLWLKKDRGGHLECQQIVHKYDALCVNKETYFYMHRLYLFLCEDRLS